MINKLANIRLAVRHIIRKRLLKEAAWPRSMVEGMVGDLIPDSKDKGYSEADYWSRGMFGDSSLTPTIQQFYDSKRPNYTNIQQMMGMFELMRQRPELMERFKKHYLSMTPQQRANHPLSRVMETAAGLTAVRMKGMQNTVNDYRQQFINYNPNSPSFDLNAMPNKINDMILNNSYVSPHLPTYQKVINPIIQNYKPAQQIPTIQKQPTTTTTTTGYSTQR